MKKILPALFYLFYLLLIFWPIVSSSGVPMAGDWSQPYGTIQAQVHFQLFSNTWHDLIATGMRNIAISFYPIALVMKGLFSLGVSTVSYSKYLLPTILLFAGCSMFSLLSYLKIGKVAAFIGGLIYISAPLFFNYSILGWVYILFFISALLPLATKCFLIAINEKSFKHIIVTAILFSIASIQAQSVIIFPTVFVIIGLINIKKTSDAKYLLLTLIKILGIFLLLTSYWLPGMLIMPEQGVVGSDVVSSSVSVGTAENLTPINILRLFGSLYNYQYETITDKSPLLTAFSFILPLLAISSLSVTKFKRVVVSFWVIGLIPLFMYFINQNRELLSLIPFANVFRDFSRFTVLSTFAYSVLAGVSLHALSRFSHKIAKTLFLLVIIIMFFSSYPWWGGELTNWSSGGGRDIRIRMYEPNPDYIKLEKYLSLQHPNYKALYIPLGGMIGFNKNEEYNDEFEEIQDIFSLFSPIPGSIVSNDKIVDGSFVEKIRSSLDNDILNLLSPTNFKYIILRKEATVPNKEKIIMSLNSYTKKGLLTKIIDNNSIIVYEIPNPKPLIYSTTSIPTSKLLPTVNFQKKNSSKYLITINNAQEQFVLVFNEQFHPQWKVFQDSKNIFDLWTKPQAVDESNHLLANGFSNSWRIDPNTICSSNICSRNTDGSYSIDFVIEFLPQRVFYVGLIISGITLVSCLGIIVFMNKPTSRKKSDEK